MGRKEHCVKYLLHSAMYALRRAESSSCSITLCARGRGRKGRRRGKKGRRRGRKGRRGAGRGGGGAGREGGEGAGRGGGEGQEGEGHKQEGRGETGECTYNYKHISNLTHARTHTCMHAHT